MHPHDRRPPGPSVHVIVQARIMEGFTMPLSRGPCWPRDQTCVPCHSCSKNGSVPSDPWRTKFMVSVVFLLVMKYWDPQQNTAGLDAGWTALPANLAEVIQLAMPDGTFNPQLGWGESRRSSQVQWEKQAEAAANLSSTVQKQDLEHKFPGGWESAVLSWGSSLGNEVATRCHKDNQMTYFKHYSDWNRFQKAET